jgi:hypothetical protein
MIKIVSFANKYYLDSRQSLISLVDQMNLVEVIAYVENDLDLDFREKYKNVLSFKRGYGYWIWKPYLILKTLLESNENDIILYLDSTDVPSEIFFDFVFNHFKKNDLLLVKQHYLHDQWTKRDCFKLMDCDDDKYHNQIQLEAGVVGVRNTKFNIKLIEEWLMYCSNIFIISDLPNICGLPNYKGFIEHRHDQSILTNLAIKYDLPSIKLDNQYISYNSSPFYKRIYKYVQFILNKLDVIQKYILLKIKHII